MIIIDHQYAQALRRKNRFLRLSTFSASGYLRQRQTHDEFAASILPFAYGLNGTAMHLQKAVDQVEPDTQTFLRTDTVAALLRKHIEQSRQHAGQNTDTVVAHGYHGAIAFLAGSQPDLSTRFGVTDRVVKQIGKHLLQAYDVSENN